MKHRLVSSLLATGLLAACSSASEQAQPQVSRELQAMTYFSGACVQNASNPERIGAWLGKYSLTKSVRPLSKDKQAVLKVGNDDVIKGWEVLTTTDQHYAITVSKKHACMLTATHMQEAPLHAEFKRVVDTMGIALKSTPRRGPHPDTRERAIDSYIIPIVHTQGGPGLSLIQTHDASHLAMIIYHTYITP